MEPADDDDWLEEWFTRGAWRDDGHKVHDHQNGGSQTSTSDAILVSVALLILFAVLYVIVAGFPWWRGGIIGF